LVSLDTLRVVREVIHTYIHTHRVLREVRPRKMVSGKVFITEFWRDLCRYVQMLGLVLLY
jgi:hypothetical protein